jgi:hypothetical protein
MPLREFQEFIDPDGLVWKVDISFLTSTWGCIFGQGCPGVYPAGSGKASADGGCCTHGVYLEDADEVRRVKALAKKLTPQDWQLYDEGRTDGMFVKGTKDHGPVKTRVFKGVCIFANRDGFEGGIGCAFHHYALRTGVHPADVKPHACWMLPLRDDDIAWDDDGNATKRILTDYRTKDWGEGVKFTWYCIDRPEAFANPDGMVYRTSEVEIRKIVGDEVYEQIADHIDRRRRQRVPIPLHPTQRKAVARDAG